MGLPAWLAADDGVVVAVPGAVVGDDDETLPPEDPHAASNSAAEAASATTPYRARRLTRVARVAHVPGCFVDIIVLITCLQILVTPGHTSSPGLWFTPRSCSARRV